MEQLYMLNKLNRAAFKHRLGNIIRAANDLAILAKEQDTEDSCLREDLFTIKGMVDQMTEKKTITEVFSHHTDEEARLTYIDAYFAEDDGEVGMTVAVVCRDTGKVIAYGEGSTHLNNAMVQEAIKEVQKGIGNAKERKEQTTKLSMLIYDDDVAEKLVELEEADPESDVNEIVTLAEAFENGYETVQDLLDAIM